MLIYKEATLVAYTSHSFSNSNSDLQKVKNVKKIPADDNLAASVTGFSGDGQTYEIRSWTDGPRELGKWSVVEMGRILQLIRKKCIIKYNKSLYHPRFYSKCCIFLQQNAETLKVQSQFQHK